MKQMLLSLAVALALLGSATLRAEGFEFDVSEPRVKVTIPDIPQIKMDRHPLHGEKPHLQFLGSEGPISVSIMTPTADKGMTAKECAISVASSILRQFQLNPSQVFRGQINDHTFAILYGLPAKGFVQLHAQFVSAASDTYCIQVHVSKVSRSKEDLDPWFKGFTKVNVEANTAQPSAPRDAPQAARP